MNKFDLYEMSEYELRSVNGGSEFSDWLVTSVGEMCGHIANFFSTTSVTSDPSVATGYNFIILNK